MESKPIVKIVFVVVIVILLGSLLVPIINSFESSTTVSKQVLENIDESVLIDDKEISMMVSSSATTWAVTTDGKLYGCGQNNYGQQGDGTTTDVTTFTQRLTDQTVASVCCSDNTTWAVTTDGKLYGCGRNNFGQQGDGTTTDVTTFTQRLTD